MTLSTNRIFILTGPSGVGKSTFINHLMTLSPHKYIFCVSHTTRDPRHGEIDGKEYYFISRAYFKEMIEEDAFIEHAQFAGNFYGTSRTELTRALKKGNVILDVDLQGARQIRSRKLTDITFIFLRPPRVEDLKERLYSR